ncbi:MAG: ECF-type sigma factor [Planctomycetota bacterium]
MKSEESIDGILLRINGGEEEARSELFEALYSTLHRRAANVLKDQAPGQSLQPTALVSEFYLRLRRWRNESWNGRSHFLATAAKAMRQILVDHARARSCRGGAAPADGLAGVVVIFQEKSADMMALNEAMQRLASFDSQMATAVELRFFGGLSAVETARLLAIPMGTFEKHYRHAKTWLQAELR